MSAFWLKTYFSPPALPRYGDLYLQHDLISPSHHRPQLLAFAFNQRTVPTSLHRQLDIVIVKCEFTFTLHHALLLLHHRIEFHVLPFQISISSPALLPVHLLHAEISAHEADTRPPNYHNFNNLPSFCESLIVAYLHRPPLFPRETNINVVIPHQYITINSIISIQIRRVPIVWGLLPLFSLNRDIFVVKIQSSHWIWIGRPPPPHPPPKQTEPTDGIENVCVYNVPFLWNNFREALIFPFSVKLRMSFDFLFFPSFPPPTLSMFYYLYTQYIASSLLNFRYSFHLK